MPPGHQTEALLGAVVSASTVAVSAQASTHRSEIQ